MKIGDWLLRQMGATRRLDGSYLLKSRGVEFVFYSDPTYPGSWSLRAGDVDISHSLANWGECLGAVWEDAWEEGRKAGAAGAARLTVGGGLSWDAAEQRLRPAGDPGAAEALEDALIETRRRLAAQDSAQRAGLAEVLGRVARLLSELEEERRRDVQDGEKGSDDPGPPPLEAEVREVKDAVASAHADLRRLVKEAAEGARADVKLAQSEVRLVHGVAERIAREAEEGERARRGREWHPFSCYVAGSFLTALALALLRFFG